MGNREKLAEASPEALVMDEFEVALVGVCTQFGRPPVALYDKDKIIEVLVGEGMTQEDAVDHFEFNIIGGWVGEYTPAFVEWLE